MHCRALLVILTLSVAACAGDEAATGPTATVGEAPTTTLSAAEREVEAAYLRSWELYKRAMLDLSTAGLNEVYAREQLERTRSDVEDQIRDGRPVRFDVEHDYTITLLDDRRARVRDRYVNHGVILDPVTREPVEPDPNESVDGTFSFERISGAWMLVDYSES